MSPAVILLSMSVILTSGTLSLMNSFSYELGIRFSTLLEAPHVIDIESQDLVRKSLEDLFSPGGSLVFFPSYKLMDKLCKRWHETRQWSRLNARKPLYVELSGGSKKDLETELTGYTGCNVKT